VLTRTASMTTAGHTVSGVAAVRPSTYAPCALLSVETPKPANHQWTNGGFGFGISQDEKALRPEVATT
jgi:hypothetical protein